MMDLFVGPTHRTVFWLGPPTLGTRSMDRGAKAIGQVMREEAAKRAPDVVYVDTYKLFSTQRRHVLAPHPRRERQRDHRPHRRRRALHDGRRASISPGRCSRSLDARWQLLKQADLERPDRLELRRRAAARSCRATRRHRARATDPRGTSTRGTTAPSVLGRRPPCPQPTTAGPRRRRRPSRRPRRRRPRRRRPRRPPRRRPRPPHRRRRRSRRRAAAPRMRPAPATGRYRARMSTDQERAAVAAVELAATVVDTAVSQPRRTRASTTASCRSPSSTSTR